MLEELFSLAGRVAVVTGGNGGLGRAMALGLRAAGARVAVTGRNPVKNAQVAAELGTECAALTMDVHSEQSVADAISGVVSRFGRLDILVNNAGVAQSNGPVTEMPRSEWDAVIETNLTGAFLCAKHAARAMIDGSRGGKIINIASIYACYGPPDFAHYPSAKAGLFGLTRALAAPRLRSMAGIWWPTDSATREGACVPTWSRASAPPARKPLRACPRLPSSAALSSPSARTET